MKKTDARPVPGLSIPWGPGNCNAPEGSGAAWNVARVPLENDAPYTCPACFQENYVAIDPSGGRRQRFGEDCPVCCRPLNFTVEIDRAGDAVVTGAELDE